MNKLLDSHQRNLRGGHGRTVYILYLYSKLFRNKDINLGRNLPKDGIQVAIHNTFAHQNG